MKFTMDFGKFWNSFFFKIWSIFLINERSKSPTILFGDQKDSSYTSFDNENLYYPTPASLKDPFRHIKPTIKYSLLNEIQHYMRDKSVDAFRVSSNCNAAWISRLISHKNIPKILSYCVHNNTSKSFGHYLSEVPYAFH